MRLPRLDVNQNSRSGCQSILAARSVLNLESGVERPVAGSILTISGGFVALSHTAATVTPLPVVDAATRKPPNRPPLTPPTPASLGPPAAPTTPCRPRPSS